MPGLAAYRGGISSRIDAKGNTLHRSVPLNHAGISFALDGRRALMLDDFPAEVPLPPVEKPAAELVGFISEKTLPVRPTADVSAIYGGATSFYRGAASSADVRVIVMISLVVLLTGVAGNGTLPIPPDAARELQDKPLVSVSTSKTPIATSNTQARRDGATLEVRATRAATEPILVRSKLVSPRGPTTSRLQAKAPRLKRSVTTTRAASGLNDASARTAIRSSAPATPTLEPKLSAGAVRSEGSPVVQGVQNVAALSPPPVAPVALAKATASDELAVLAILESYRQAFERLDADAASRLWPGVDERRLARAFSDLASQDMYFERCQVDIKAAQSTARCRGRAMYVPRIGNRAPQTQARNWTFQLNKVQNQWTIRSIQTQ